MRLSMDGCRAVTSREGTHEIWAPDERAAIAEIYRVLRPSGTLLLLDHVRDHDGRAWVEERPGGGARFVVELPEVAQ